MQTVVKRRIYASETLDPRMTNSELVTILWMRQEGIESGWIEVQKEITPCGDDTQRDSTTNRSIVGTI